MAETASNTHDHDTEPLTITERVQQVQNRDPSLMVDYQLFDEFYQRMEKAGLVQKQGYTAAPLDTTGRRLYEMQQAAANSKR